MIMRKTVFTKFACLFHVIVNISFSYDCSFESSKRLKSNARIASSYQQRNFASHYILFVLLTEGATVVWAYWTVAF